VKYGAHILLMGAIILIGCRKDPSLPMDEVDLPFALRLPPGAPMPTIPEENPLTVASVALGKALFFDPRLSRDASISCGSCHHPDRAFSDTVALSLGVEGRIGFRNAPTLANVAYHPYFFREGGIPSLEFQVNAPISDPLEMDHNLRDAATAVANDAEYQRWSQLAYGRPLDAFVLTRSIANYQRTLISGWSRYDRYLYQGEDDVLTEQEVRGLELFNSPALNCTACHSGFDLTDYSFQNIGQYLDYADPGRARLTSDPADMGKYKVPTLRNIALTAPYMHDGAMANLDEVIDHFANGGLAHPNKSPFLTSFALDPSQKGDLLAFLNSLTDERNLDQVP